ncbi:hypothetical protein FKM82_014086 [Ascaphus truei]
MSNALHTACTTWIWCYTFLPRNTEYLNMPCAQSPPKIAFLSYSDVSETIQQFSDRKTFLLGITLPTFRFSKSGFTPCLSLESWMLRCSLSGAA